MTDVRLSLTQDSSDEPVGLLIRWKKLENMRRNTGSTDNAGRRTFLQATGGIAALGATGVAGCVGGDTGTDEFTIGIAQPMSGDLEYYGEQGWNGFLSGLAYKADDDPLIVESPGRETYEVNDVTYELIFEDTEFDPSQAQTVAEDLVEDDNIDLLFGFSSSDSARQVIETVTRPAGVPTIIGPAADADITYSDEYCDNLVFRANETAAMDAQSGGRYAANEMGIESVYVVAADNAFGRSVADNYGRVFEEEGIEVAGEQFVEPGFAEFDGVFDDIEGTNADATLGGFTFATLPAFLEVGLERDIDLIGGFATLVTSQPVGDVVTGALGEEFTAEDVQDAGLGPFTTRYHWNQYDNEINEAFVDMYVENFGIVPDLFTAGTFTAASALVQAVEETGSADGADIAAAMQGMTVTDTPKGENAYTFQEHNNQAKSAMTVADVVPTDEDAWPAAIMPGAPVETYDQDEAATPQDAEVVTCDL